MKRLVRENRRQASVGGGSQRYKVESCDTLQPKGESNREHKADLSIRRSPLYPTTPRKGAFQIETGETH